MDIGLILVALQATIAVGKEAEQLVRDYSSGALSDAQLHDRWQVMADQSRKATADLMAALKQKEGGN